MIAYALMVEKLEKENEILRDKIKRLEGVLDEYDGYFEDEGWEKLDRGVDE